MTDELKECRESFERYAEDNRMGVEARQASNITCYKYEAALAAWIESRKQSRAKPEGVDIEAGAMALARNFPAWEKMDEVHRRVFRENAQSCAAAWHLTAKEESK